MPTLYDMHCHLGFAHDADELIGRMADLDLHALSCSVMPEEHLAAPAAPASPRVRWAIGLHPWWIDDGSTGEDSLALIEAHAPDAPFIGEIGLDFRGARSQSREAQTIAFERILAACETGKLISLHSCCAEDALLDILERRGAASAHDCVLHWFSGSDAQLQRAVKMGCYFSIGPRMIASKRGRAYARVIPEHRLLLETDLPARKHAPLSLDEWHDALLDTLEGIARARNDEPARLAEAIAATSARLLERA